MTKKHGRSRQTNCHMMVFLFGRKAVNLRHAYDGSFTNACPLKHYGLGSCQAQLHAQRKIQLLVPCSNACSCTIYAYN